MKPCRSCDTLLSLILFHQTPTPLKNAMRHVFIFKTKLELKLENYLRIFWRSSKEIYQRCFGNRNEGPAAPYTGRCLTILRSRRDFALLLAPLQPQRSCPLRTSPPLAPTSSCFSVLPFMVPCIEPALTNPHVPCSGPVPSNAPSNSYPKPALCRWLL